MIAALKSALAERLRQIADRIYDVADKLSPAVSSAQGLGGPGPFRPRQ